MADPIVDPFEQSAIDPAQQLSQPLPPMDAGIVPPFVPTVQPQAPMAPPPQLATDDPKQKLLALAALGFMLGAGRGSGLAQGAARGVLTGQNTLDANNFKRFTYEQAQQREHDRQQQESIRQQQETARINDAKQRGLLVALERMKDYVGNLPNKAQYDQELGGIAQRFKAAGYQVDENWLREAVPYLAPDIKQRATVAFQAWLRNPQNQALLKTNPEKLNGVALPIDVDGDNHIEMKPLTQVAAWMGSPFTVEKDENGNERIIPTGAATPSEHADATGIYNDVIAQYKAEGKNVNDPKIKIAAKEEALRRVKNATAVPTEAASPLSLEAARDAVLTGRMAPSQAATLMGGFGKEGAAAKRALTNSILKADPKFDFVAAESNYQFGKNVGTQNTVRYIEGVKESIPLVIMRAEALANGNVRSINALLNTGKNAINDVDLKKFKTDTLLVADEIAKILQGGGTGNGVSDAKLRQAKEILDTTDSPAAIRAALGDISQLLEFRRETLTRGTFMQSSPNAPAPMPSHGPVPVPTGVVIQRGK